MNTAIERPAEVELAPCPCGAVPRLDGPDSRTLIRVVCECGARGTTIVGAHGGSFDEAIAAWNSRAVLNPQQPAEVERVWKAIISAWSKAKGPQGAPDMEWAEIAARAALNSRNDAPVAWRAKLKPEARRNGVEWELYRDYRLIIADDVTAIEPLFTHPPEQSAAPPAAWKEAVEALSKIRAIDDGGGREWRELFHEAQDIASDTLRALTGGHND